MRTDTERLDWLSENGSEIAELSDGSIELSYLVARIPLGQHDGPGSYRVYLTNNPRPCTPSDSPTEPDDLLMPGEFQEAFEAEVRAAPAVALRKIANLFSDRLTHGAYRVLAIAAEELERRASDSPEREAPPSAEEVECNLWINRYDGYVHCSTHEHTYRLADDDGGDHCPMSRATPPEEASEGA